MADDWVDDVLKAALEGLDEERNRTRTGFESSQSAPKTTSGWSSQNPDPIGVRATASPGLTQALPDALAGRFEAIWKKLPALNDLPADLLRQMPFSTLLQLNEALVKEGAATKGMESEAKLARNVEELARAPTMVPAGLDDRKDQLHPARFLGGAGCSAQMLWLKARDIIGTEGVIPIGNYDLDSVGCGGCVTAKGWQEIHRPASTTLNLKYFHISNVGSSGVCSKRLQLADGENAVEVGDSLKELTDLEEFKSALATAREAMAFALPWNFSVAAIQGFMYASNYCAKDLNGSSSDSVCKLRVLAKCGTLAVQEGLHVHRRPFSCLGHVVW